MERDRKTLVIVVISLVLLWSLTRQFYGYGMMGAGMGFGAVLMLLFWVAVIWAAVALIGSPWPRNGSSSLEALKMRYAKGEISKKEFERIKKELRR